MQGITRDFWPISRFISQMIQDRATVTTERVYETKLSNGRLPFSMTLNDPQPRF